jgi:hypothetical protein
VGGLEGRRKNLEYMRIVNFRVYVDFRVDFSGREMAFGIWIHIC